MAERQLTVERPRAGTPTEPIGVSGAPPDAIVVRAAGWRS